MTTTEKQIKSDTMNTVESGIPGLDELLRSSGDYDLGGIPRNSSTLVYGPPKVGKSIFVINLLTMGLT